MIQRLYAHNYRCFQNFDLTLGRLDSALLVGKNGAGKTTVGQVLRIFQRIARGDNRLRDLLSPDDRTYWNPGQPVRLELTAEIKGKRFGYQLAFELPEGFREFRVLEEIASVDGETLFSRSIADVTLARLGGAQFRVDWHLLALPIIQERSSEEPLSVFRRWLSRMIILSPIPSLMSGDSDHETLEPSFHGEDVGAWFAGLMAHSPAAYSVAATFLQEVMPDFVDIQNPSTGANTRRLELRFRGDTGTIRVPFSRLSTGEKCFLACALVLAACDVHAPVFCFWDEPDAHLALDEIGPFVMSLRHAFLQGGQILMTSHNGEAIRKFTDDTTYLLRRRGHLEPTVIRTLEEWERPSGDVVEELTYGSLSQ